jgi:formate dehydrogenase major subunit
MFARGPARGAASGTETSWLHQAHRRRSGGVDAGRHRLWRRRRALAAAVRPFKLAATSETRNTCTYCSVACGVLIYSRGDRAKNARSSIIHIEGDPDHPVNRGTLCPKGSALLDVVHAPTRLKVPRYRAPGSDQFKPVSWDFALDRIATLMKQDRDANFVATNAAGTTVNRWTSTGMLAASASSTETSYLTWKVTRALGMLVFDNQARV